MQVHPIKPALKAQGFECLKLKCDDLLSNAALNFNLRRYLEDMFGIQVCGGYSAGAYTRPLLSSN